MIPGDRIGAIQDANPKTGVCNFFGYGIFEGNFPMPVDAFGMTEDEMKIVWEEINPGKPFVRPTNPRMKLDDGTTVWGYQCWWGAESQIKQVIEKFPTVNMVKNS